MRKLICMLHRYALYNSIVQIYFENRYIDLDTPPSWT